MINIISADLILAGNCIFTAKSELTGKEFTYKITQCKTDKHLWFVRVLKGNNKQRLRDYYLLCMISQYCDSTIGWVPDYMTYQNRKCIDPCKEYEVIKYIVKHLPEDPPRVQLYHAGYCARCGRRLTDTISIKRGLGRRCSNIC